MKILVNPNFKRNIIYKKSKLKPYEVVELEKFIEEIETNPEKADQDEKTKLYKREIVTTFCCIIVYEYDPVKDTLIYWAIE